MRLIVVLRWSLVLALTFGAGMAQAVDFELKDLAGKTHKLSDYRGKWVVVNYWATWCPPCLDEIPDLVAFHEKHAADSAVVLGVNVEDIELTTLAEFADHYFISYPVLLGSPGTPGANVGPIPGLPTTYLVSPDGELAARNVGPVTGKMLERFIREKSESKPDPDSGKAGLREATVAAR